MSTAYRHVPGRSLRIRLEQKISKMRPATSLVTLESAKQRTIDELYELGMFQLRSMALRLYREPHNSVGRETLTAVVYAGLHKDEDFVETINAFATKHNVHAMVLGELRKLMEAPNEATESKERDSDEEVVDEVEEELLTEDPRPHKQLATMGTNLEELQKEAFLKAMSQRFKAAYKDAGNKDKARYALAAIAILRLLQYRNNSITRSMLFSPWEEEFNRADIPKMVVDQSAARAWQRDFLSNLENHQIVEIETQGHTTSVHVTKEGAPALGKVLHDAVYEEGRGLKWLLWPKDSSYEPFPLFGDRVEQEKPQEDGTEELEGAEMVDEEPEGEISVLREVADQLTGLAMTIGTAVQTFSSFEKSLREREEENQARADLLLSEMGTVVGRLTDIANRLDSEERSQLRLLGEKLVEMEARNRSWSNQAAAEARKEEKLREDLSNLLTRLEKKDAKP